MLLRSFSRITWERLRVVEMFFYADGVELLAPETGEGGTVKNTN